MVPDVPQRAGDDDVAVLIVDIREKPLRVPDHAVTEHLLAQVQHGEQENLRRIRFPGFPGQELPAVHALLRSRPRLPVPDHGRRPNPVRHSFREKSFLSLLLLKEAQIVIPLSGHLSRLAVQRLPQLAHAVAFGQLQAQIGDVEFPQIHVIDPALLFPDQSLQPLLPVPAASAAFAEDQPSADADLPRFARILPVHALFQLESRALRHLPVALFDGRQAHAAPPVAQAVIEAGDDHVLRHADSVPLELLDQSAGHIVVGADDGFGRLLQLFEEVGVSPRPGGIPHVAPHEVLLVEGQPVGPDFLPEGILPLLCGQVAGKAAQIGQPADPVLLDQMPDQRPDRPLFIHENAVPEAVRASEGNDRRPGSPADLLLQRLPVVRHLIAVGYQNHPVQLLNRGEAEQLPLLRIAVRVRNPVVDGGKEHQIGVHRPGLLPERIVQHAAEIHVGGVQEHADSSSALWNHG